MGNVKNKQKRGEEMSVFYRDIDVKISDYKSELSKPLVIFERDRGLEIYFNLVEYAYRLDKNPKNLLENLVGAYATVTLVNPDGYEISIDEVEITEDAKVKFVITEDLTDELTEIGTYQLQIHVNNDIKGKDTSVFSVPPFSFEVRERLKGKKNELLDSEGNRLTDKDGYQLVSATSNKVINFSANKINEYLSSIPTIQGEIKDFNSQLDNNANILTNQINELKKTKKYISSKAIYHNGDYSYYQAIVTNPIGINYTNTPIGIRISFESKECISEKCIEVTLNNSNIEFQWEDDNEANPKFSNNFGRYNDGSLRSGIIWVNGNINANEELIYTIKVYRKEKSINFNSNVNFNTISEETNNIEYELTANNISVRFMENFGYSPRKLYVNNVEKTHETTSLVRLNVKNSSYADVNSEGVTSYTITNISNKCLGNGVVFKDFISVIAFKFNENIQVEFNTRMWANGNFDVTTSLNILDDLDEGVLNGFNFKCVWLNDGTQQYGSHKDYIYSNEILGIVKYLQNQPDYDDTYIYSFKNITDLNATQNRIYSYWQLNSPNTKSFIKGTHFRKKLLFSNTTKKDDELLRRTNPIFTVATKNNITQLKAELSELSKVFIDNMLEINLKNTFLPGCNTLMLLSYDALLGTNNFNLAESIITNQIQGRYLKGDFYKAWSVNNRGIEYIDRELSCLPYLLNKYKLENNIEKINYYTNLINKLADFFVKVEEVSGGNGKVKLHFGDDNNKYSMNAQTSAMKALNDSLELEENETRRNCYNRIKAEYERVMNYKNISPQNASENVTYNSAIHYEFYSMFNYVFSVKKEYYGFYPCQRVYENIKACGLIDEMNCDCNPKKRGLPHSYCYAIGILLKENTPSSLQLAVNIMNMLINKCFAFGYHEFPIDNWITSEVTEASSAIETQALGEVILNI